MLAPSPSQHLESEIRPHGNPPYDSDIPNPALARRLVCRTAMNDRILRVGRGEGREVLLRRDRRGRFTSASSRDHNVKDITALARFMALLDG